MRTAAEIVEDLAREVLGSTESLDSIERRQREFEEAALAAPLNSMTRAIAAMVAAKLQDLRVGLAVTQFRL